MKDFFITPNDFDLNTDSENIQQAINEAKRTGVNQIVIPRINKK
jgi:hypothetical protein